MASQPFVLTVVIFYNGTFLNGTEAVAVIPPNDTVDAFLQRINADAQIQPRLKYLFLPAFLSRVRNGNINALRENSVVIASDVPTINGMLAYQFIVITSSYEVYFIQCLCPLST